MNKMNSVLWGVVFIILGVIFGLNALEITDINLFFDGWWTLFIIVPSIIGLFNKKNKTSNLIFLIIGISLLLVCQNIIDFSIISKLLFPLILILIGLGFIFRNFIDAKVENKIKELTKDDANEYYATFGKSTCDFRNEKFDGCSLNGIFGSCECNLKDSIIKNDVSVIATAVFGEVVINVPSDVNVKVISTNVFGEVNDNKINKNTDYKNTVFIKCFTMFGGVNVR